MNPPAITIADWKPRESGTLRGFFTANLASGLILHSKPMVAEGVALRDERGKVRYGAPLIGFTSPQARNRFIEQVLAALRLAQPQVFAAETAA